MAGGGVDAVEAGAEIDAVEIEGEDFVLRHPLFELAGEGDFLRLALHCLARAEDEVFHQLLGDGGGARDGFAGSRVGEGGAGDGGLIGAVVFVEALVLGGDESLGDVSGELCHRDGAAIAGAAHSERVAFAVDELDGWLALGLPEIGDFGQFGHAAVQALPFPECPAAAAQDEEAYGDQKEAQRAEAPRGEGRCGDADNPWHAGRLMAVGHVWMARPEC